MFNNLKSSIAYSKVEVAKQGMQNKVKKAVKSVTNPNTVKTVAQTACTASAINNTVKAGMCAAATVTGTVAGTTVAPAAAVTGAVYYGGKAYVQGTIGKMVKSSKETTKKDNR